ncbi:putative teichoic acid biosynthesis protein F [Staphylococcus piscifermentans]|uniref:Glycerophosphate transferase n=1 Tax=Staphylococcus piscifermentans TaxID=70258 RepID=A0A239TJV8_9STAP|nr:CDP-glycerol:glycerophosphate glycerophosphotransferase [Staphylococcus piscifermentans]RTX86227.1 CDP-glycerol:glycerophosphate glycerophosphotransferase [Staphylococcus piscifermentans]GEP85222.1 glycerophosphate transferase [Staphylococcus piscifermentans]SNU98161.1 putative teichoic acid biosynthesis protein F [Staphylococcus piscifermentans]
MNDLTIVITYYNSEEYITECINSLKKQRNQNFDIVIVNDGSEDNSKALLDRALQDYNNDIKIINLTENHGHAYARNVGIEQVETPYFMFLDADDQLASYAVNFYLKKLNGLDGLVAPIYKFTLKQPQFIDYNKVKIEYLTGKKNPNSFLRKNTACNIIFKTSIVRAHNIQFDEALHTYIDRSFLIDYVRYVNRFVRIFNFPFYYRGEVYHPFESETLSEQDFDKLFEEYVESYFKQIDQTDNKQIRDFLNHKMIAKIKRDFDPARRDIEQRYDRHRQTLKKLAKHLKWALLKEGSGLFKTEMVMLMFNQSDKAFSLNKGRAAIRHLKNIATNSKRKNRSIYELKDKPENVSDTTILFETFGGKNYSDSPKYIYEYMMDKYPEYHYIWVFNEPEKHSVPGNAVKVKRGSSEYYKAYSDAHYWVTNARTPLYLHKKENQTYIQTWHGTPLKRLANDMKVVRMPGTTTPNYKRNFHEETSRWDYLISPNRYSTEIFESAFWMNRERILEIGYPRNDVLVNRSDDTEYKNAIREGLNIPEDKKVILYAPTWRDDEFIKKGQYLFDLRINLENLQEKLGDEYVLLLRMHYLIANALDLSGYEEFAVDVSNYNDISELYLISDALITDYSSVMFDYGILKRPQFFFAYDIDKYDKGLRGFYMDYMNDLPGPIYTDPFKLADGLKQMDRIAEEYSTNINAFYERFCSLEKGTASEYIGEMIHKDIENK